MPSLRFERYRSLTQDAVSIGVDVVVHVPECQKSMDPSRSCAGGTQRSGRDENPLY